MEAILADLAPPPARMRLAIEVYPQTILAPPPFRCKDDKLLQGLQGS